MVSCDVTGGITLGTKLKMPIFTLYLPHNLQSRVSKDYVIGIRFQIELNKICVTKIWSDQEVNNQIDKDLNPYATRPNFHRDNIYLVDLK